VVICLERGADCLHGPADATASPNRQPLASFKSILVLPFWYRLTQAVLKKRPLNGCSSSSRNLKIVIDGQTTQHSVHFSEQP